MANIGSLVVDLQANSAAFLQEMTKARTAAERTAQGVVQANQQMGRAFQAAENFVRGFVGALSVGALLAWINNSMTAAAHIADLARQVGLTTDALQGITYAASQAGISAQDMEQGFRKFQTTILAARNGSQEAIDAFNRLHVLILDINGNVRPTGDILNDVANALSRVADPGARAAAVSKLFGEELGTRLAPLLAQGAVGIREFVRQAEAAGAVIGGQTIEALQRSQHEFEQNQQIIRAWGATIGEWGVNKLGEFLTALRELARAFNLVVTAAGGMDVWRRVIGDPIQRVNDAIAQSEERLRSFRNEYRQLLDQGFYSNPSANGGTGTRLDFIMNQVRDEERFIAQQRQELTRLRTGEQFGPPAPGPTVGARNPISPGDARGIAAIMRELQQQQNSLNTPNRERADFINQWAEKLPQTISRTGQQADAIRNLAGALYDAQQKQRVMNEAFDEGQRISESMMTQQEQLADQLARLNFLRDAGALSQQSYNRAVADAYTKLTGLGDAVNSLGQAFSSAFEAAIVKGESLRNVLGNLLADIGKVLVRVAVLAPLENAIKSGLGSLIGSFGGGSSTGGGVGHGSAMGDILTARGPIALASGGIVDRPYLSLIGEGSMNEAVVPLPDGRRIPVDMRGGGRNGGGVVVNMPIDARGAGPGESARLAAAANQIVAMAVAAMAQGARDGGGVARQSGARKR